MFVSLMTPNNLMRDILTRTDLINVLKETMYKELHCHFNTIEYAFNSTRNFGMRASSTFVNKLKLELIINCYHAIA